VMRCPSAPCMLLAFFTGGHEDWTDATFVLLYNTEAGSWTQQSL
jgi:hypothetical protein